MGDLNMTMEEYIKLEEEKARRHGRAFNWQTNTYAKIRIDDDLYDLSSVEVEFPDVSNKISLTNDSIRRSRRIKEISSHCIIL
ncbi:hypothetical protein Tco_0325992, partial [Tanacetum coccineum]